MWGWKVTGTLIVLGVAGIPVTNTVWPLTMDNMSGHLSATGVAAFLLSLGVSRTPLGQHRRVHE